MESLSGIAEDKETTEQDNKKPSEQEVSPLFPLPLSITRILFSFYCLVYRLMVHHTHHAHHPLKTLLSNLDTVELTSLSCLPFSPAAALSVFFPPRQTSSTDPTSVPEKAADSEESKASSEEKTGDERSRTESPTKTEPSANQKESALRKAELSSSQNSPKSEWCMIGVLCFFP